MTRALLAGMTDYSRQSFDDIVVDLGDWLTNLDETLAVFNQHMEQLRTSEGWGTINGDVRALMRQGLQFYKTARIEIDEILEGIQTEVQSHHVSRLKSLSRTADELNRTYGQIWHGLDTSPDRTHRDFDILEDLYVQGRNRAVDLIDLGNVAARLADFKGRKGRSAPTLEVPMDSHKHELIREHERRLKYLELQQAREGFSSDPKVLIEIDLIREKIEKLKA